MKLNFIFLAFFLLCGGHTFAQQEKANLITKIRDSLSTYVNSRGLADSLTLYTSGLKVQVNTYKKSQEIFVTENDTVASTIFNGKHKKFLESLDYRPLSEKRKKFTIVIPIAMIVANYKAGDQAAKQISLEGLAEKIARMFACEWKDECDNSQFTYLQPMIIVADKAAYH